MLNLSFQSLCYPLKISSEDYIFDSTRTGKSNLSAVKKLQEVLEKVPLIEKFIKALEQLYNPEHMLKVCSIL